MDAHNVTSKLLEHLEHNPYQFIVVNYANGDMVGHTGDVEAATKAITVVDKCVGTIVERLLKLDAHVLITADHGNAEEMTYDDGSRKTSHTKNPVELIYVAHDSPGVKLLAEGSLQNVAPTVLELLGVPIPKEMTAESLIVG
jgi:2,3-bisphosphoglycerate-independent phosphoglycerate mutase